MGPDTLENAIENAIPSLFGLANKLTWNKLSTNCKFIITEIKDSEINFHDLRRLNKIENDKKIPATLQELMPILQKLYFNFYDINLQIYKANKHVSIIDIRYYSKSSLDKEYHEKVRNNVPMLHCKVPTPPWTISKKKKFDINWEHNKGWNWLKMFLLRLKLKVKRI